MTSVEDASAGVRGIMCLAWGADPTADDRLVNNSDKRSDSSSRPLRLLPLDEPRLCWLRPWGDVGGGENITDRRRFRFCMRLHAGYGKTEKKAGYRLGDKFCKALPLFPNRGGLGSSDLIG